MVTKQPLGEVFGFPPDNVTAEAEHCRRLRLCPFNNKMQRCTKDKADDPLGVCSVHEGGGLAITCPVRFRQSWRLLADAAEAVFPPDAHCDFLEEVRLRDGEGHPAGNIDFVLVSRDCSGQILDFVSLEVQAVYISGNVRKPFEYYMSERGEHAHMHCCDTLVRPDYLSSSRKRLVPQLLYKGGILKAWGKKQVVAIHEAFFETLPVPVAVDVGVSDLVWLIYGLDYI